MIMYFLRDELRGSERWTRVKRIVENKETGEIESSEMLMNHSPDKVKKQLKHGKVYIVR